MSTAEVLVAPEPTQRKTIDSVTIRFAGDSGDGLQVTGAQFTQATAIAGNDLATFPDFPAEIRAPVGTTFGVSAFQIHFGSSEVNTPGDVPDVLVLFNPAALKVNLGEVAPAGLHIVDVDTFSKRNLQKAGFDENPLEDKTLDGYRVLAINITKNTVDTVKPFGLSTKESQRCKNFWVLGLLYWLYGRDRASTVDWINNKFSKRPELAQANIAALNAGHIYGETAELDGDITAYQVPAAKMHEGLYRNITGGESIALGLVAGAKLSGLHMDFCSYPITPASAILHELAKLKSYGVTTFQAEDEIAAVCAAIGASFAGHLGVTSSSGPGIALKGEAIGLAVGVELPLIVVNSQRAGPSTGMPTKAEQSDLNQALYGRNADAPLVVLSTRSPSDGFETAIEAIRLATKYMTPVMLLTDGYTNNASEPWLVPSMKDFAPFEKEFRTDPEGFHPFVRDEKTLARAWAKPGTPGLTHRIGGIERGYDDGHISYDPENHQKMTDARATRINNIANDIPLQDVDVGETTGKLALVGWGSTYGAIRAATLAARKENIDVSHIHLRHIWPLPSNLGDLLKGFDKVIVPEMNNGQLVNLLRSEYLIDAQGLSQVTGKPFKVEKLLNLIRAETGQLSQEAAQ